MESEAAWSRLLALGDEPGAVPEEDAAETLVYLLHRRGEPVVLEWALLELSDADPWHRQAAAWVLGELGFEQGRPFAGRVVPALVRAARLEQDDDVRQAIVAAIGHADDPAWVGELLRYAADGYAPVRETVAAALPIMFAGDEMSPDALAALILLTRDPDPDVRDWATFSLGNQSRVDSDAIRDALAARLDDDGDNRFEAAVGLARRGDPRALHATARRLHDATATIYLLDLTAAAELADPTLLPALERLNAEWGTDDDAHTVALDYAIDRCQPATHDRAGGLEADLAAAVNAALADIGWTLDISGTYPLTTLTVRRPDGSVAATHDRTLLWDGISPTDYDLGQEAASWSDAIRGIAATDITR